MSYIYQTMSYCYYLSLTATTGLEKAAAVADVTGAGNEIDASVASIAFWIASDGCCCCCCGFAVATGATVLGLLTAAGATLCLLITHASHDHKYMYTQYTFDILVCPPPPNWPAYALGLSLMNIKYKIFQWSVQEQNRQWRNIKNCRQAKHFTKAVNIRLTQYAVQE